MKQIKTNNHKSSFSPWNLSPCTIAFVAQSCSFNKSSRFKMFSIYHLDPMKKIIRKSIDKQNPKQILWNFRKQIQQASGLKKIKSIHKISSTIQNIQNKYKNQYNNHKHQKFSFRNQLLPLKKNRTSIKLNKKAQINQQNNIIPQKKFITRKSYNIYNQQQLKDQNIVFKRRKSLNFFSLKKQENKIQAQSHRLLPSIYLT